MLSGKHTYRDNNRNDRTRWTNTQFCVNVCPLFNLLKKPSRILGIFLLKTWFTTNYKWSPDHLCLSLSFFPLSLSIYIYENVYRLFPLPEVLRENPVKLKSGASLLVSSSLLPQTRLKHNQMCHRRFLMTHTNAHS